MTDRPIIFSGPMVRALLDGRKTQTRRLASSPLRRSAVGDRLYVRETWRPDSRYENTKSSLIPAGSPVEYIAGGIGNMRRETTAFQGRHRPYLHMPRWASRLTLIVEATKVEPLQAMEGQHPLESDALAEGVHRIHHGDGDYYYHAFRDEPHPQNWCDPTDAFRELWSTLHTKPGERWEDNPAVVVLTFRVKRGNIDQLAA